MRRLTVRLPFAGPRAGDRINHDDKQYIVTAAAGRMVDLRSVNLLDKIARLFSWRPRFWRRWKHLWHSRSATKMGLTSMASAHRELAHGLQRKPKK